MTVPESVSGRRPPDATVYCGTGYAEQELRAGLERLSAVSTREFRALSEADGDAPSDGLTLVFTDALPDSGFRPALTAAPAIWVTTDAEVARAAVDQQVSDVFNWSPADGWELLAAKLDHRATEQRRQPRTADAPERALQRISDGVLALDESFRITYLNNAMSSVLTGADGDRYGDEIWQHLPTATTEVLRPAFERAMAEGTTVTTEFQTADADRWFEVTAYPASGGLSVYGREITERKDRENQQELYEHLVKTVGDAVYILDGEGRFTFVNDALCEMTGYDREQLLGSSVHIIKDDETVHRAEDALRELLREQHETDGMPIAKLDVDLVTATGERIPCTDRMTLRPLEDGELTGTVGTLRDISRQQRRQDILSGILAATQDMMTATTTEEVADVVVETVSDVFEFDLATVREHDPETDQLVPVTSSAAVAEAMTERPPYGPDEGPVGTAYTEDRLVVHEDPAAIDDDRDRGDVDIAAYCPIGDRRTLSFGTCRTDEITDDERRLVELLAETAAAAFDAVRREEQLERYETVLEAADDRLFTLDSAGEVTLATDELAAMLGTDPASLTGRHVAELVPESVAGRLTDRSPADVETELRTVGGETIPSRIRTAPFDSPYEQGVVATVQDITELKSAQQAATRHRRRFAELFETLSDPVADVEYGDDGARVARTNAAFAALCGETADDLRNRPLAALQRALPDALADAIDPIAEPQSLETDVTTQTDTERKRYILKTVPYDSEGGKRAFLLLTDVTDLTQRETHLKVLHRLLRHNLRNETTVIQGYAESLIERDTDERTTEYAERIYDASSSLVEASDTARTIQQVLGMDPDDVESVPVDRLESEIRSQLAGEYPAADLDVTSEASGTAPFSHHLLVGIRELVDNAVTHTDAPVPTVTVELADAPAEDAVTVRVRDDGPGIPDDEWEVVARDREITQLQHAQGLGLWLVRWVVDKHSGQLRLEESDADGTTVTVTLPR